MSNFINNLAYKASAGSGKTFMLVVRYLSLLFKGADSKKILTLTFTNKAASEMQERIIATLEDLEHRGELDEIVKVTGFSKEYLLENRKRVLREFLNSNVKIMTIDSFFAQVLRKFSLYASLMPDFSTANSQHEIKLLTRFLKEVDVAGHRDTLISLSLDFKKRVTNIFDMLDDFYSKANELEGMKFVKQNEKVYEDDAMDALNSLASLISNCKGASATLKNAVVADNFYELASKSWIEKESLNYWVFKKCYSPEFDFYLTKIQDAIQNHNRAKEQNFFYALTKLVSIYKKAKKALYVDDSELSFSDVTVLVHYLLKERVDSEFLYFRLDSKIEHILLDEFQDTSIMQYEILKPLINEITSGEGIFNDGSFFFVGDVKQSIYRFRGGVSALFDEVTRQNATHTESLLTNYRSQKEVIEFVNKVFEHKIKGYEHQLVRADASGGYVEVALNDEPLEEVVKIVQKLLSLGADIDEMAVLCATNSDGYEVKERLEEIGVDVVTETTTKLINQKSIKALLEYLKYLYFGADIYKHNFFALINMPLGEIERVDFNKVKLLDVVKRGVERYNLFGDEYLDDDENIIRFFDALSRYSDIEALLFEYERLDASAAMSELRGVRVLTVHKSKGLEYEHVIVMDRLKNPPNKNQPIIYEYDGIELKNIYLRIAKRESIDKQYANALLKEAQLEREDKLNSLYVAFTRARDNLFIVKNSEKSMFDILDISPFSRGALEVEAKQERKTLNVNVKFDYTDLYYGTQSDILELEKENDEDIKSINFGLALHYMLEMMPSFDLASIDDAKDMMLNKYGHILDDTEIAELINRVKMLLSNTEFKNLSDGECYKEKPLRYKNNLRYVDLLVKHKSGVYNVIDYKSSELYAKEHIQQVGFYVKAIKEITGERVDGYICYLLEDEIKIVKS
ncbi:MAG: RecB-like helicase [Campylobacterales bacterium]|nr:RecB-like helicase [Campylobacterales bacterium]